MPVRHPLGHRAAAAVALGVLAAATAASAGQIAAAPVPPPPPAGGHGQVIAQGAVSFGDSQVQWTVSSQLVATGAPAVPAGAATPSFMAVTAGALVVTDADATPLGRFGTGEALFLTAGMPANAAAADGLDAEFQRIGIAPAGSGVGDPFAPGVSVRDIDLVRELLAPGEVLPVADSLAAPALVLVTSGSVTVTGGPSGNVDVAAGSPTTIDGALTITNGGAEPAAVLVGVVGLLVQTGPQPAGPTPDVPPSSGPTTSTGPSAPDADSDGLSDEDESLAGTMVDDPDSDGDGLSDGEEVHQYGTDPLSSRTDSDHLEDGLEIERGTDPLDEDTDDDGCQDSSDDLPLTGDGDCDGDTLSFEQERQLGTDPANPDTDEDGLDDDMDPQPLTPDGGSGTTPPPPDTEAPSPTTPETLPPPPAPPTTDV